MSMTETKLDHLFGPLIDRPRRRDARPAIVIMLLVGALVAAAAVPLIGAFPATSTSSSDAADALLGP